MTLEDWDKLPPLQLIVTRDGNTPLANVVVQVRIWVSPLTDPSVDSDMYSEAWGTTKRRSMQTIFVK